VSEISRASVAPGAAAPSSAAERRARLRALGVLALLALTFAAFWPTTVSLMGRWEDTTERTYTHGYLVLVLASWMVWRDRDSLSSAYARPFLPGLGFLVLGAVGWLIAWRAGLEIVHQMALPALAAMALLVGYGRQVLRRLAFVLAWLCLAIPIWDALLPLLNWISVMAVRILLRIADVPAYFVHNTFEIPQGTFAIADGCSGLHFFVVSLTVSLLYGEINRDTPRMRARLVAFALLLAMATNWLRVFIIVVVGYVSDMQHRLITGEHYTFGWYLFAGMMLVYFLIVRRWPAGERAAPAPVADDGPPVPRRGYIAALAGLALAPLALCIDVNRADDAELESVTSAPAAGLESSEPTDWRPLFPGADREIHGVYAGSPSVEVHIAGFAEQRQGKELTGHDTSLLGDLERARGAGPAPAPWRELAALDAQGGRWLLWYSYRMDSRWYPDPLRLQVEYGLLSLTGAPAAAVVALRARCDTTDCESARNALADIAGNKDP
jgi:exosortase A